MEPLDYALGAAATARLARLVTQDTVFDDVRLKYVRSMDSSGHMKLAELAVCSWCISVWIGAIVAVAGTLKLPGYRMVTSALAFSFAAGVLNELGSDAAFGNRDLG